MKTGKFISMGLTGAVLFGGMNCFAQNPQKEKPRIASDQEQILVNEMGEGMGGGFSFVTTSGQGQGENTFVYLSTEMSLDGKVVKNAPYSADAVTEMSQTLSDGNKIVHRTTASVYRDNDGRTRKEQAVNSIGPYVSTGQTPQTIFIYDPVAGVSYVLDSHNKIARKMMSFRYDFKVGEGKNEINEKRDAETAVTTRIRTTAGSGGGVGVGVGSGVSIAMDNNGPGDVMFERKVATAGVRAEENAKAQVPKVENLGTQMIEGVAAEGKRITNTIPAGQIGNEREINIVNETWYSQELQTVVMSKRTDPMSGDMTYRLTNINRTEPAKSLFEIPGDYTVKEGPKMPDVRRMKLVD